MARKEITIGSAFSGIGLFELGLAMGLSSDGRFHPSIKWQIEIDPFCRRVLERRFPDSAIHTDITQTKPEELHATEIICAGWPCQDHSVAGRQKGLEGEKSGLFWYLFDLIRVLRPRVFVLENVPAVCSTGLDRCLSAFASLGAYDIEWINLRAADFGAPHRRERIFFVGILADPDRDDEHGISEHGGSQPRTSEFLDAADAIGCGFKRGQTEIEARLQRISGGGIAFDGSTRSVEKQQKDNVTNSISLGLEDNGPRTQRSQATSGASGRECAGYVSNPWHEWTNEPPLRRVDDGSAAMLDRNKRLHALGNAVVPQCAEWIGRRLIDCGIFD